jgi:DNA-binding MarR family transcriptional regulator
MQQFVDSHSRHGDLAQALGFRLGAGRGKFLFQLRRGALTLTELARATGVDASYATLIVDKLEAHGLVERQLHPDDRRRKLVILTAAGRDAVATADAILRRPPRAIGTLRSEELRQLIGLLERLIAADEPEDPLP